MKKIRIVFVLPTVIECEEETVLNILIQLTERRGEIFNSYNNGIIITSDYIYNNKTIK